MAPRDHTYLTGVMPSVWSVDGEVQDLFDIDEEVDMFDIDVDMDYMDEEVDLFDIDVDMEDGISASEEHNSILNVETPKTTMELETNVRRRLFSDDDDNESQNGFDCNMCETPKSSENQIFEPKVKRKLVFDLDNDSESE